MMAKVDYFHEHTETPAEGKHFADCAFEEMNLCKAFESQAGVKLSHCVESHRTHSLPCLAETLRCKSAETPDVLDTHEKWCDRYEGLNMNNSF